MAAAPSAHAQYIVHDPTSLAQIVIQFAKQLLGFQNIIGATGVGTGQELGTVDGEKIQDPCQGKSWSSLTDYFEKCAEPRRIKLEQASRNNQQQFAAALQADSKKMAEAQAQIGHAQDLKRMNVQNYANALGLDEGYCERPSLGQSVLFQRFLTKMRIEQAMNEIAEEGDGSSKYPAYAKGPLQNAQAVIAARKAEGLIDCTGNDGANAQLCAGGGSNTEYVNADQKATTLLGSWLLDEEPKKQFSEKYATMYVKNNLFDDRAITPIRKDEVDNLSSAASEILADRGSYAAKVSMFMHPFVETLKRRQATQGVKATPFLEAALTRAGITGDIKERLIKNNKTSEAGSDFIRYQVYVHDPRTEATLANRSALNQTNIMAFSAERQMDQVSLLYEIRKTLEETNLLLGLIGAQAIKVEKEQLESQTQAVAAAP